MIFEAKNMTHKSDLSTKTMAPKLVENQQQGIKIYLTSDEGNKNEHKHYHASESYDSMKQISQDQPQLV